MKIGLDIHGVIDTNPEFFRKFTEGLKIGYNRMNHDCAEIHILTGSRLGDGKIKEQLEEMGISYTHLFSISDYLKDKGCQELYMSTDSNPWFFDKDWNMAKADYARAHKLDLVLDDNNDYFPHFTTPIARFYSKDKK